MSDRTPLGPADEQLGRRVAALIAAPDRRDWGAVLDRVTDVPSRRARLRRPARLVALGGAFVALAGVLVTLLVLAPDPAPTSPAAGPDFTMIPTTPAAAVPATIRQALRLRPDTPVAKIGSFATPDGTSTVWRARNDTQTFAGRYIDSVEVDNGNGSGGVGQACVPRTGGVFPADPPGSPARIAIPDVVGMTVSEARHTLEQAGLRLAKPVRDGQPPTAPAVPDHFVVLSSETLPVPPGTAVQIVADRPGTPPRASGRFPSGSDVDIASCSAISGPQGATVVGGATSRTASLELAWADGTTGRIPVQNGAFVASFPLEDCRHLEFPEAIVLRDRNDLEIGRVTPEAMFALSQDRLEPFDPARCRPKVVPGQPTYAVLNDDGRRRDGPIPAQLRAFSKMLDWTSARTARADGPFPRYGRVEFVVARSTGSAPGLCLVALPSTTFPSNSGFNGCLPTGAAASGLVWNALTEEPLPPGASQWPLVLSRASCLTASSRCVTAIDVPASRTTYGCSRTPTGSLRMT
jgi:PASTA domain